MPVFSVVIPVYKVEKYIRECLESISNQTFRDFEVLCVDDCGNDGSIEIVEEFAKNDPRFKILKHEQNRGVSAARNTAFDNVKGEYIICIDPDDFVVSDEFEQIYNVFQEFDTDCVWFNSYFYNDLKKEVMHTNYGNHRILNKSGFYKITPKNIMRFADYVWDKAYRTSKIKELNLRFPEGLFFEDAEFYFKCFTQITEIYYLNERLYYYREREGSTVTKAQKGNLNAEDIFKIYMNCYNYTIENNIYEKYKLTLIEMLGSRIKGVLIPNQYEKIVKLAYETLNKINFPDAFQDLN